MDLTCCDLDIGSLNPPDDFSRMKSKNSLALDVTRCSKLGRRPSASITANTGSHTTKWQLLDLFGAKYMGDAFFYGLFVDERPVWVVPAPFLLLLRVEVEVEVASLLGGAGCLRSKSQGHIADLRWFETNLCDGLVELPR